MVVGARDDGVGLRAGAGRRGGGTEIFARISSSAACSLVISRTTTGVKLFG